MLSINSAYVTISICYLFFVLYSININFVGNFVGFVEDFEDTGFLTKIFGHGNTADGLFDGLIHFRHGAHALACDFAGNIPIENGQNKDDRHQ